MSISLLIGITVGMCLVGLSPILWHCGRDLYAAHRFRRWKRKLSPQTKLLLEIERETYRRGCERDSELDSFGIVLGEVHLILERDSEALEDLSRRRDTLWTDADYRRAEALQEEFNEYLTVNHALVRLAEELRERHCRDYDYYRYVDEEVERADCSNDPGRS